MTCSVGAVRLMVCFVGAVRPPTLRRWTAGETKRETKTIGVTWGGGQMVPPPNIFLPKNNFLSTEFKGGGANKRVRARMGGRV